jgi:hypothetical protein
VNVSGWTIHFTTGAIEFYPYATLSGTIPPGGYYLVQMGAAGGSGSAIPTPDATGIAGTETPNGSLVLRSVAGQYFCSPSYAYVDRMSHGVGYCAETSPTGALGATTAALRAGGGCTDTDNNALDFSLAAPAPRNSASTPSPCGITRAPAPGWGALKLIYR